MPGFLSLTDAAGWAGVSPRTLRRWIGRGLPTYQANPRSKVLIRPSDIELFLTRQQAEQPDLNAMVEEVFASVRR
jgi:predicted site-specific integrase-resolvase